MASIRQLQKCRRRNLGDIQFKLLRTLTPTRRAPPLRAGANSFVEPVRVTTATPVLDPPRAQRTGFTGQREVIRLLFTTACQRGRATASVAATLVFELRPDKKARAWIADHGWVVMVEVDLEYPMLHTHHHQVSVFQRRHKSVHGQQAGSRAADPIDLGFPC